MWLREFILIIISSCIVTAVNEDSLKDLKCFVPTTSDFSIDYEWVMSNTNWYFPLFSKLDVYRTAWDLLQKPVSEISEEEINSACIYSSWEGMSPSILGFNGKTLEYDITPMSDSEFVFSAPWRDGSGGKMYLVKTDNHSYILFLKCWDDEEMSWNVMSTSKILPPSTQEEIIKYTQSLGFKAVFKQNYDSCKITTKLDVKSEL